MLCRIFDFVNDVVADFHYITSPQCSALGRKEKNAKNKKLFERLEI